MNEKTKHRIVGIIVIIAFLVIILPSIFKKSVQGGSSETSIPALQPIQKVVSVSTISTVTTTTNEEVEPIATATEAEPIVTASSAQLAPTQTLTPAPIATPKPVLQPKPVALQALKPTPKPIVISKPVTLAPKPVKAIVIPAKPAIKTVVPVAQSTGEPQYRYCLQMGVFRNIENAQILVERLKAHNFNGATLTPVTLANGITVQRVNLCRKMTPSEARELRFRIGNLINTPIIVVR